MKPLDQQDYYEVLEVSRGAAPEDVERAYELTRAAYAENSLATYSIFGIDDAAHIRSRIDEAYEVLSDPAKRHAYDEAKGVCERPSVGDAGTTSSAVAEASPDRLTSVAAASELPNSIDVFEDLDVEVEEEEQEFDGAALRRARLRRGIELDQIANVTKVSNTYLRCIEDEVFTDLPATVYVRGFVTAYARAIGLDPLRVATSYMPRLEEARSTKRKAGLLSRS